MTGKSTLLLSVLIGGCSITPGSAYDSVQDNPKNALPETFVLQFNDNEDTRAVDNASSEKWPQTESKSPEKYRSINAEDDDFTEYQKWVKAKESNSAIYQEFLEFQNWLEFRRNSKLQTSE